MSTYKPDIKIFYGPLDSDHRLVPAPNISISLEYQYSNDTIVGYSYIINLTGFASALDLRNLNYGDNIPEPTAYNTGAVIDHIHQLRKIFTQNGNVLHVVNGIDNSHILRAKGGILRSFTIDESSNNMMHYSPYTATIEFNTIDLVESFEDCDNLFLDPSTYNTDGIVDINKFKIKSFQDSWSFSFDENESFDRINNNDVNINLNINNHSFNIEYNISAVGKHFFKYSDELTGESTVLPAWEQAKNFVQYRLYNQVKNLIDNVLKDSYTSSCTSPDGLDDILQPGSQGLMNGVGNSKYKIFNETITCEASESDGSFSAKYNAIIKSALGNNAWSSINTKHTVNKSITTNNSIGNQLINININGSIQGLIEGGLITINEPLTLPSNGTFFILNNSANNRYLNAKELLDKIYNETDYGGGIGENSKKDLKQFYKAALGITLNNLNMQANPGDTTPDAPHPTLFNLTHDYNNGIINYTVEYSNKKNCGRKFHDISIQTNNPNKVIAVFNIPNSNACPLIQELGTYSAKRVTLTVKGIDTSEIGQPTNLDAVDEIMKNLTLGCYDDGYLPIILPPLGTYIITQKQYTNNPIDGSFSVVIAYICGTTGCNL